MKYVVQWNYSREILGLLQTQGKVRLVYRIEFEVNINCITNRCTQLKQQQRNGRESKRQRAVIRTTKLKVRDHENSQGSLSRVLCAKAVGRRGCWHGLGGPTLAPIQGFSLIPWKQVIIISKVIYKSGRSLKYLHFNIYCRPEGEIGMKGKEQNITIHSAGFIIDFVHRLAM